MRFALIRNDPRVWELVVALDENDVTFAATWRAVGEAAERLGFPRPSYELVRRLVKLERLRRERRTAVTRARLDAAGAFFFSPLVVDFPIALDRLEDARRDLNLVTQRYEPLSDSGEELLRP